MNDDATTASARRAADGTATDGRKGVAYVRDHYAPAAVADLLAQLAATSS